jgi:hypothetical protein
MAISVDEFRSMLPQTTPRKIVEDVILNASPVNFSSDKIDLVLSYLSSTYQAPRESIEIVVSGSARLGFSLVEKRISGTTLPRYRPFSADSDIDLAVISPVIFDAIWHDLTSHSHRVAFFPWRSGKSGDYLICGWLRPDFFRRAYGFAIVMHGGKRSTEFLVILGWSTGRSGEDCITPRKSSSNI